MLKDRKTSSNVASKKKTSSIEEEEAIYQGEVPEVTEYQAAPGEYYL